MTDDSPGAAPAVLRSGDAIIDLRGYELRRAGERVHVEPQVFDVIRYLVEHADRVVSKEELLDGIWGTRFVSESSLTSRIRDARRALGDDGREQHVIQTVHGRGYRWALPVLHATPLDGSSGNLPPSVEALPATGPTARPDLPTSLTAFVGRRHERATLLAAVREHRLVTASGPGGVGKTRLALAAAFEMRHELRDGVVYVDLAEVIESTMVVAAIADSAGITERPGTNRREALRSAIGSWECLLVIDNCEHLLDAARDCVEDLLRAGPGLRVLATSRIRLMLPFEHVYVVPGLSLDDGETGCSDAEQLFTDRMAAAGVPSAGDPATRAAIRDLCRSLDGMALAIELAAARVPGLGLDGLARAFGAHVPLLTVGRTDDHRHRSLRAAIDWTYRLLDDDEQTTLRAAAVFAAPFDVDALAAVMRRPPHVVLDLVARLVDWNLAARVAEPAGRYRVLETIRQFASERADASEESDELHVAHLDWAHASLSALLADQAGESDWCDEIDLLLPEVRAALHWAGSRADRHDAAGLAGMLAMACYQRGLPNEAQQRFHDAARGATDDVERHRWLRLAAGAAAARNVGAEALDLLAESATTALAAGRREEAAIDLATAAMYCLRAPGIIARSITEDEANGYLSAARAASTGAPAAEAAIAVAAAWAPESVARSLDAAEHALDLARDVDDPLIESAALDLAIVSRLDDDLDAAAAAAARRRELMAFAPADAISGFELYDTFHMSCQIDLARGDFAAARHHADVITALPFFREARHVGLCRRMEVEVMAGNFEAAVRDGDLFETDWKRAGQPTASNLAVGCYAVATAHGILGDLEQRSRWIDNTVALIGPARRSRLHEPGWAATLDALFELHRGDADAALARLSAAPDDRVAWANPNTGLWRRWYAAAWAEACALTNPPDAAERAERAERVARGNRVAELLVDRARCLIHRDLAGLRATAGQFDRLGALYQADRSLRLADELLQDT